MWIAASKKVVGCVLVTGSGGLWDNQTTLQLSRWLAFLEIWEKAFSENKKVITALDANLDLLTWRTDDLPTNYRSVKLKSLTDALFERIIGSLISGKELSFATVVHGSESQNHGSDSISRVI